MKIVSLASGSGGNAYVVESQGRLLLIDCGLCHRELKKRLETVGFRIEAICGVVITHEHADHVKGLAVLHKRHPFIPFYANLMTAEAIEAECDSVADAFMVFENGMPFQVGPFDVCAFTIPHDVCDPVGYVVKADGLTYFHATDVGSPLDSIGVKITAADIVTIESNHDPVLLSNSARPEVLKARIRGPRGHLCNYDAATLVQHFANARLRSIALAHLSSECNAPRMALDAMIAALSEIDLDDRPIHVLSQDEPVVIYDPSQDYDC